LFLKHKMKTLLQTLETEPSVKIKFITKKNTIRIMESTRNLNYIPDKQRAGLNTPMYTKPGIIWVYDLMVKDWRAIREDAIIQNENK